jgi:hypothetical protein
VIRVLVLVLAGVAAAEGVLGMRGYEPRLGLVAATVAVAFAGGAVVWRMLAAPLNEWRRPDELDHHPVIERRLAAYAHIIESDLAAPHPDPLLRDVLRDVAQERLHRRHGLTLGDPGAAALLGPDLVAVLQGSRARLRRRQLSDYLSRIEAL